MKTLIEELREWQKSWVMPSGAWSCWEDDFNEILSRHAAKVEEPLAVLADRKGYFVNMISPDSGNGWDIHLCSTPVLPHIRPHCNAPTYAECEDKCRQYLNTLKDKGEIK